MPDGVYVSVLSFIFGLLIGSFLNVLIYRLPRDRSVITGRSKCPQCDNGIAWYDNVPLLSYFVLRGRCRHCRLRIPVRYPVVELITGATAVVVVRQLGPTLQSFWVFAFLSILLVITLIDWSHRIIPDVLTLGGVVFGCIGALVCLDITIVESLLGAVMGGGLLFVIAGVYRIVRKVDGMGGGDLKLMAMIGAFLGWQAVFPVLILASFLGAVYGLYLMWRGANAQTAVAFGSFLAPSAAFVYVFGGSLWQVYLRFVLGQA